MRWVKAVNKQNTPVFEISFGTRRKPLASVIAEVSIAGNTCRPWIAGVDEKSLALVYLLLPTLVDLKMDCPKEVCCL